jgi:hypothetical protein
MKAKRFELVFHLHLPLGLTEFRRINDITFSLIGCFGELLHGVVRLQRGAAKKDGVCWSNKNRTIFQTV